MNIVGIGAAGVKIAERFSVYPEYEIYKIDSSLKVSARSFPFPTFKAVEDYESRCPKISFAKKIKGDVLFVIGGSGKISSASLAIMEQFQHCSINVLYIQPDVFILNKEAALREKVAFHVLQHYARSGKFERLYLANNLQIEEIVGNIPIASYYDVINTALVSSLHMINVFSHEEPIISTMTLPTETERIVTFGIVDIESGVSKAFFDLRNITNETLFYAINSETLREEDNLMGKIRGQIASRISPNTDVSFGIYETDYDSNNAYCLMFSKIIQGEIPPEHS